MAKIIGNSIKILRESSQITQASIAHFLGVDQALISKAENGERCLPADMIYKLACLFGISVDAIESEGMKVSDLTFAFNSKNLSIEDMEAISAVNRIVLNSEYMAKLLSK